MFAPSTADQAAPALTVTGFAPTDTLLVTISMNNAPTGTTFRLPTTAGLTPSYGNTFTSTMRQVGFTGTTTDVNTALAAMLVSTGAAEGAFDIDVNASVNQANVYYYPDLNKYYEYVAGAISWTGAETAAQARTVNGANGYLVTITSAAENTFLTTYVLAPNAWIGASDAAVEGEWRWVTGPEAGTQFWQGGPAGAGGTTTPPFNYASWRSNQPDNFNNEDYGSTNVQGILG